MPEGQQHNPFPSQAVALSLLSSAGVTYLLRSVEHSFQPVSIHGALISLGYSPDAILSGDLPYDELVHPEDRGRLRLQLGAFYNNTALKEITLTYRLLHPDGTFNWYQERYQIDRSETAGSGRLNSVLVLSNDIINTRAELTKSEDRLHFSQDTAGAGWWDYDVENRRVICSEHFFKLFGMPREESAMEYDKWLELFGGQSGLIEKYLDELLQTYSSVWEDEIQIYHQKQGVKRWVLARARVFGRFKNRRPKRIMGVFTDIDAKKRVELDLLDNQSRISDLAGHLPGILCQLMEHPNGRFSIPFIKGDTMNSHGYTHEEFFSNPKLVFDLIHPDDLPRVRRRMTHSVENNLDLVVLYRSRHRGGQVKWLETHASPRRFDDGSVSWNGIVLDVTSRMDVQQALENTRRELEQVLEAAGPMCVIDGNFRIVRSNSAFRSLFKDRQPENKLCQDLHICDCCHTDECPARQIQGGKNAYQLQIDHTQADGIYTSFLVNAHPFNNRSGNVTGTVLSLLDISEKRHSEILLQKSEEMYRNLVSHSPDMILLTDPAGLIEFINRTPDGSAPMIFEGREFYHIYLPEDCERLVKSFERCVMGKETVELVSRTEGAESERIWIIRMIPVFIDEHVSEVLMISSDISKYEQAREELQSNEERYRSIVENISDGIFVLASDFTILDSNQPLSRMVGWSREEMVGNRVSRFIAEEDLKKKPFRIQELSEGKVVTTRRRLKHKQGRLVPIESVTHQMSDGRMMVSIRDISERLRQEEVEMKRQEQLHNASKMASLGTLTAGVGHEINNPNNFIMMNIPLLQTIWKDAGKILDMHFENGEEIRLGGQDYKVMREETPKLLQDVLEGSRRIRDIVKELRDYAHQDDTENFVSVRLNDVIQAALSLLGNTLKKSTDRFELELEENLPVIHGSFLRLEQIVINLVQNACQALHSRNDSIKLSTRHQNNQVILEIIDEGVGIPEEHFSHLGDPFFTTKRDRGGTGLGLSLTQTYIKNHQGEIHFSSAPSQGTTVRVSFPVFGAKDNS